MSIAEVDKEKIKNEGKKFFKLMKQPAFDAKNTPLYLGGSRTDLSNQEISKSVKLMIEAAEIQKHNISILKWLPLFLQEGAQKVCQEKI